MKIPKRRGGRERSSARSTDQGSQDEQKREAQESKREEEDRSMSVASLTKKGRTRAWTAGDKTRPVLPRRSQNL